MLDTSHSLLELLCEPSDPQAWDRLIGVYTPFLRSYLRKQQLLPVADVDDLVQEVLLTMARELPQFQHNGNPGAFRSWLRMIVVNRLRHFWRTRQQQPQAVGGSDFLKRLDELEDQASNISHVWEQEHNLYTMRTLMELVRPRFAEQTWQAFRRQVMDGESVETVMAETGLSANSVYVAKFRVLRALRQAAEGLVD